MGKTRRSKHASKSWKNVPFLEQDAEENKVKRIRTVRVLDEDELRETEDIVDAKLTKKILAQAEEQKNELVEEMGISSGSQSLERTKITFLGTQDSGSSSEPDEPDSDAEGFDGAYYECVQVDKADERALEMFMNTNGPARRTLADVIMEKISEKQTEITTQFSDDRSVRMASLDPRIASVYRGVGQILSMYRSGKLPKAFKIIPALRNWEEILYITKPERWSAAAIYQATRIFSARLHKSMTQRFYNLILLPRVRDDIAEYKKLNFYLYQALRKALFKPAAFFKGILLPLCESGMCTLREAVIVGGIVARNTIPMLHSAAALLKIAEMDYNGANSVFLRILLDKRYALPYRVIDALVYHFLRFQMDRRELPILWHQALLAFAQRYKEDMSGEQKEALMGVLKVHFHYKITPEIQRELQDSKCRPDVTLHVPEPLIVVS